jgi:hypothetical protein
MIMIRYLPQQIGRLISREQDEKGHGIHQKKGRTGRYNIFD